MKSKLKLVLSAFGWMLFGIAMLLTFKSIWLLMLSLLIVLLGWSIMSSVLIEMIFSQKIYRFLHYFDKSNNLHNESYIVGTLTEKLAQFKKMDIKIFDNQNILTDSIVHSSEAGIEGQTRVTGYIKARNKNEALRTLHYTTEKDFINRPKSVPNLDDYFELEQQY